MGSARAPRRRTRGADRDGLRAPRARAGNADRATGLRVAAADPVRAADDRGPHAQAGTARAGARGRAPCRHGGDEPRADLPRERAAPAALGAELPEPVGGRDRHGEHAGAGAGQGRALRAQPGRRGSRASPPRRWRCAGWTIRSASGRGACGCGCATRSSTTEHASPLARLAATADFGNGIAASLPFEQFLFINADLHIHLHRQPRGSWIGIDARTLLHPGGTGLAESVLHDEQGPVGRAFQALVVQPR